MAAKTFRYLEVNADLVCLGYGGTVFGRISGIKTLGFRRWLANNLANNLCTLRVSQDSAAVSKLRAGRVLRVVWSDASYDEYRILTVKAGSGIFRGLVEVVAVGIEQDLARGNSLVSETINTVVFLTTSDQDVTPSTALTGKVLPAAQAQFAIGTVTPTAVISLDYAALNPLEAALAVVREASRITGIQYELSVTRNGNTNYQVNITVVGTGAAAPDFILGVNMRGVQVTEDDTDRATSVVVVGRNNSHVGNNWWIVSAVNAGLYFEVQDILGGPGPSPETNGFTNYYWKDKGGATHLINLTTVVSAGTTRFHVSSTVGIAVGDLGSIVADAAGTQMSVLRRFNMAIVQKRLVVDYDDTFNLLAGKNPYFRSGGATPAGWTLSGPGAVTEITTPGDWLTAGRSYKLTVSPRIMDSTTVTFQVPATGTWFFIVSARFRGNPTAGAGVVQLAPYIDAVSPLYTDLNPYFTGKWERANAIASVAAGSHLFRLSMNMGRVMHFDSAMMYLVQGSAEIRDFTEGSRAAQMVQDGYRHMMLKGDPIYVVTIDIVDLEQIDPTQAGAIRATTLGGNVQVTDPTQGYTRTQLRLVDETVEVYPVPSRKVVLSNRPPTLTKKLVA